MIKYSNKIYFEVRFLSKGKLQVIDKKDFNSFFKVMKKSFPEIERRTFEGQKSLFDNDKYKVLGYKNEDNEVEAFIAYWEFDDFVFVEHFAVDEKLRGKGVGSEIIKQLLMKFNKYIILEVEHPEDKNSIRRIEFYKRMNMNLNEHEYVQPPLQEGKELLPLKIMSYPNAIDEKEFCKIRKEIYDNVYKFKD